MAPTEGNAASSTPAAAEPTTFPTWVSESMENNNDSAQDRKLEDLPQTLSRYAERSSGTKADASSKISCRRAQSSGVRSVLIAGKNLIKQIWLSFFILVKVISSDQNPLPIFFSRITLLFELNEGDPG
jgi:hypothetical protein